MPLTLRPHQVEAEAAVKAEFEISDRATVVSPCATGKTLLELAIARPFRRVLILEPSLALIRQTLQRARAENILEGRTLLCVCSDVGIARDEWKVDEGELGIPVTTEATRIREVIGGAQGDLFTFCTYQSLPLLAAGLPTGFEFDLGIFDECHRTAGPVEKRFGAGLSDKVIRIRKRLFATATPRVFSDRGALPLKRAVSHSMDDVEVYGRIAFQMSNRDAIEKGIICDYQVLVSATTEAVARDAIERAREMILPQGQIPVERVASQLAVLKAIEVCGARRVVTYHSTIAEAQDFSADVLDLFHDAGVSTFHIYGAMPSSQREAVIEAFLACEGPSLISNARCLSEGVDVPAIDLIALMNKKESVGDVVQILGRAQRPYPGKATGYIMLPLFINGDQPPEQALSNSELAITWEILHTILETDEAPTDFHVERAARESGTTRGQSTSRGHLRVVAPDNVLAALEKGITVRPVSRLSHDREQMVEAARQFKDREGHLRVSRFHVEGTYKLGAWLQRMRKLRAAGRLDPQLESELNSLGVDFGAATKSNESFVRELQDFHQKHGHWQVPRGAPWTSLWRFVRGAHRAYRNESIAADLKLSLDEIQFPFDSSRSMWARLCDDIAARVLAAGSLHAAWTDLTAQQKRWLRGCKIRKDAGSLSEAELLPLRNAGVDLESLPVGKVSHLERLAGDAAFERSIAALRDFLETSPVQEVGSRLRHQGVHLGDFLKRSRRLAARGLLSSEREASLDALGIDWRTGVMKNIASERLAELKAYRELHGHQRVPPKKEFKRLRGFIQAQRKNREKLSATRLKELEEVGFTWDMQSDTWEFYIAAMRRARASGDELAADGPVANYLRTLLRKHREQQLPPHQLQILSDLGLTWARGEGESFAMIARLARIARKYGKVNLETMLRRERDLLAWVNDQRKRAATDALDADTANALRKCGLKLMASAVKNEEKKVIG